MSVRAEVERVEEQRAGAPARVGPQQLVREAIQKQAKGFLDVLPKGTDPERFSRIVLTAVKSTPQLIECFATPQGELSVLLAAMQAAMVGIEPNTPTQEAWLLPRRVDGRMECQLSISYRGEMKLARRSGTIKTIFAEVVYERDHFVWHRGLEDDVFEHKPGPGTTEDRGELTHAYAVARFLNGGYAFVVLDRVEVEARRAKSDSWRNTRSRPVSPWTTSPAAMWRKSAIHALRPYLDLDPLAARVLESDEQPLRLNEGVIEAAGATPRPAITAPDNDDDSLPTSEPDLPTEVPDGEPFDLPPSVPVDVADAEPTDAELAAAVDAGPDWKGLPDDVDSMTWLMGLSLDDMRAVARGIGTTVPANAQQRTVEKLAAALDQARQAG